MTADATPATDVVEQLRREIQALAARCDAAERAIRSRPTIEQAKGIIMATVGCDADTAFAMMVEQSKYENRKLHLIADELVSQRSRPSTTADRVSAGG